jgi:FkbM family methyltransferase
MAIAAWKRLEKSPGYQRKKLFFKRLVGKELRLRPDTRIPVVKEGGWWFHPDALADGSIVYSLGIGEDVDFDLILIERFACELHAFDPTPSTVDWIAQRELPPLFHFHPWAVTGGDGILKLYPRIRRDGSMSTIMYTMVPEQASVGEAIEVPAMSLGTIARQLGHGRIDLLKMDIEGAEYEVLDSLLESGVKPIQLLVEFHHRFPGIGPARTEEMIGKLRAAGYRLFAIAETGRELSFMLTGSGEQPS